MHNLVSPLPSKSDPRKFSRVLFHCSVSSLSPPPLTIFLPQIRWHLFSSIFVPPPLRALCFFFFFIVLKTQRGPMAKALSFVFLSFSSLFKSAIPRSFAPSFSLSVCECVICGLSCSSELSVIPLPLWSTHTISPRSFLPLQSLRSLVYPFTKNLSLHTSPRVKERGGLLCRSNIYTILRNCLHLFLSNLHLISFFPASFLNSLTLSDSWYSPPSKQMESIRFVEQTKDFLPIVTSSKNFPSAAQNTEPRNRSSLLEAKTKTTKQGNNTCGIDCL